MVNGGVAALPTTALRRRSVSPMWQTLGSNVRHAKVNNLLQII